MLLRFRGKSLLGWWVLLCGCLWIAPHVEAAPATRRAASAKEADAGAQLRKRVVEVKLRNGMTFLLVPRKGAPTFTGYIRVKVGGVDEQIGYTGLAHIFEHMAFKGTSVVGSKDWSKERKLLLQLNQTGEALSLALVHSKGLETPVIKALRKRLKQLQDQHKKLVKTDEFTRIYQSNGGTGLNATTSKDLTSYFINLPANRLSLWAYQEAARLAAPVFREYYRERAVVAEERRMAMSRGSGRLYEKGIAAAFVAHPYRFPTVGWMSDITTIPLQAVKDVFKQYYSPANMVGAVVGDIDIESTRKLLQRTFGLIPAGDPPPPVRTLEPDQQGERRVTVQFHTRPQLMIGFHKPTAPHFHDDVFDVIEAILTRGPSSRLYRALVKKRMAQQVWASSLPGARYPNVFTLAATPISPHTTQQIEAVIYKELDRLKKEPVTAQELQKVRNNMSLDFLRNLRSNQGLASQLTYFQAVLGDWRYATRFNKRLAKVTPEAIMQVARLYFRPANRTVATLQQVEKKDVPAQTRKLRRTARTVRASQRPSKPNGTRPTTRPTPGLSGVGARNPATATTQAAKPRQSQKEQEIQAAIRNLFQRIPQVSARVRPLPEGLSKHPKQLTFKPLKFTPPKPKVVKMANGITVYLLEDRELPLVDVYALVKTGRLYDPDGKVGLAEMTGRVMRTGGFGKMTGDRLDDELDFRGARLSSSISSEYGSASLSVHRRDLDWGLRAFASMLRYPRFPDDKINLYKARMLEQYRRRNDSPFRLALRHFKRLVYGKDSRWAEYPTPKSIAAIQRKDLFAFHNKYYRPPHLRLAIVGDFRTADMLKKLRKLFGTWSGEAVKLPSVKKLQPKERVVALVRRPIPQSLILVGHLGPRRHHPQWMAAQVMNHILGGGGFGSRLMTEIRTQRGLAYFAGSQIVEGPDRGLFVAYTGTRPPTTGLALKTMLNILREMHKTGEVSARELHQTRQTFLNRFIFLFQSPAQIVYRQAYYDYFNYPKNYLETYRERLLAITAKDVARAAKTFLHPSQFVILVVGWPQQFGDPALSTFGKVKQLSIKE